MLKQIYKILAIIINFLHIERKIFDIRHQLAKNIDNNKTKSYNKINNLYYKLNTKFLIFKKKYFVISIYRSENNKIFGKIHFSSYNYYYFIKYLS